MSSSCHGIPGIPSSENGDSLTGIDVNESLMPPATGTSERTIINHLQDSESNDHERIDEGEDAEAVIAAKGKGKRKTANNFHVMIRPPYKVRITVDDETSTRSVSDEQLAAHEALLDGFFIPTLNEEYRGPEENCPQPTFKWDKLGAANYMLGTELDSDLGEPIETHHDHKVYNCGVHLHLYIRGLRADSEAVIKHFDNVAQLWGMQAWTGQQIPWVSYKSLNSTRKFAFKNYHIEAGYCTKDHRKPFPTRVHGTPRKLLADGTKQFIDKVYLDRDEATDILVEMYYNAFKKKIENDQQRAVHFAGEHTKNMKRKCFIHDELEDERDRLPRIRDAIMARLQKFVDDGQIVVTPNGLEQGEVKIGRLLLADCPELAEQFLSWDTHSGVLRKQNMCETSRKIMLMRLAVNNTPKFEDYTPYDTDSYLNIPVSISDWINTNLSPECNMRRFKGLFAHGPRATGKTSYFRSLGPHMYFRGSLSIAQWKRERMGVTWKGKMALPQYVVLDDVQWNGYSREQRKALWCGESFNICSAAGQQDHSLVHGIPCIVMHNSSKWVEEGINGTPALSKDTDYIHDVTFVHICHRMHPECPVRENTTEEPMEYFDYQNLMLENENKRKNEAFGGPSNKKQKVSEPADPFGVDIDPDLEDAIDDMTS